MHGPSHPADRPVEPDHPLVVEGGITAGDTRWMLTCLLEEMARGGIGMRELRAMTRNPNYQALYAARDVLGDACVDDLLIEVATRVGVHRVRVEEHFCCPFTGGQTSCGAAAIASARPTESKVDRESEGSKP